MSLLSWWSGRRRSSEDDDLEQVREIVERIVRLGPQLRLARRYEARMATAVRRTIVFTHRIAAEMPAAREASATAWATDPYIHAFFATPEDVCPVFSDSEALRACFHDDAEADEGFAVLAMTIKERQILGVGQFGDASYNDVAQTTVSFSDHRVSVCAVSEAALRQEIMLRMIDQFAVEGLRKIAEDAKRRDSLELERALLLTRLKMFERQGTGTQALLGGDALCNFEEAARLQAQIDENDQALMNLGLKTEVLERDLETVCGVLSSPELHFHVLKRRFLLDRLNVVVADGDTRPAALVEVHTGRLPSSPEVMSAFSMVRFRRADLLPVQDMQLQAGHLLI